MQFAQKRRASTRLKLQVQVRVKRRFLWQRLTLIDLSREGGRLFGASQLRPGESVMLELPVLGTVHAIVRWKTSNSVGCEFDQPIDPVIFDAAVLQWKTGRLSRLVNRTTLRAPSPLDYLTRMIRVHRS